MDATPTPPLMMIERFAGLPERLARLLADKTAAQLQHRPLPDGWSAHDIIVHLRAADDILTPRLLMLLARDTPPLSAFDERRWAEVAGYATMETKHLLAVLTLRRAEVSRVLRQLSAEAWSRVGQHEGRGSLSLLTLLQELVAHEEEHCQQLEALCVV